MKQKLGKEEIQGGMKMGLQKGWINRWTFIQFPTGDDNSVWHSEISSPQEFWEN